MIGLPTLFADGRILASTRAREVQLWAPLHVGSIRGLPGIDVIWHESCKARGLEGSVELRNGSTTWRVAVTGQEPHYRHCV